MKKTREKELENRIINNMAARMINDILVPENIADKQLKKDIEDLKKIKGE